MCKNNDHAVHVLEQGYLQDRSLQRMHIASKSKGSVRLPPSPCPSVSTFRAPQTGRLSNRAFGPSQNFIRHSLGVTLRRASVTLVTDNRLAVLDRNRQARNTDTDRKDRRVREMGSGREERGSVSMCVKIRERGREGEREGERERESQRKRSGQSHQTRCHYAILGIMVGML